MSDPAQDRPPLVVRAATLADWPTTWPIFAAVVARGDSYTFAPDTPEAEARRLWMGVGVATYVAEHAGEVVGTYALKANQPGLGAHVANAGYMVAPRGSAEVSARPCVSIRSPKRVRRGSRRCSSTPS